MRIIWGFLLAALLFGCATTSYNAGTTHQETLFISTAQEIAIGEAVSKQVEKQYKMVRDPVLLERLDRIGQKIADASDRKELSYHFGIIEEKEPNAFALPGGSIYTTSGLFELIKSDDELASVLGHEMGHVVAKHALKRMQGAIGLQLLQIATAGTRAADARTQAGMDLAFTSLLLSYSQEDELEADRLGVRYAKRAGFNPMASIDFLTRLRDETSKQPSRQFSYFRTHPYFGDRIRVVRQESQGQLTFDDYINTNQEGR